MISVRRARVLPLPSFRFRLATDTLGFGYDLPAAGRSWDFHPLERALAGRTKRTERQSVSTDCLSFLNEAGMLFCKSKCSNILTNQVAKGHAASD